MAAKHASFLQYRSFRYLKLALLLSIVSIVAYVMYKPTGGRYGGTLMGYGLGILGTLMMIWLGWFGVRKRKHQKAWGSTQGWLSAHVYLGLALIVVVLLHTSFEFGLNVHTLAFVLMIIVIVSGMIGTIFYATIPGSLTREASGESLDTLIAQIDSIDEQAYPMSLNLSDATIKAVTVARKQTQIGGSFKRMFSTQGKRRGTDVLAIVAAEGRGLTADNAQLNQSLYTLLVKRESIVAQARSVVRYKAILDVWLYVHVPTSVALIGAMIAHILSVFFYW